MQYSPHAYQAYATGRIIDTPKVALLLGMGLGKTVITLTAINELIYYRWEVRRALIVAPKKVAEATWQKEARKWDHLQNLRISTVLGTQAQRVKALNQPADIYITNRDNVPWLVDYYQHSWPFDMVVLDESSSFKNSRSQRFKALKLMLPRISRLVELTGTPAPNGLTDLWAQIYLLDQGKRLGRTLTAYRDMYFDPDQRSRTQIYSYKPRDGAKESIEAAISDIAISMQAEDYLALPDMVMEEVPVMLDAKAEKAYTDLERDLLLEVEDQTITAGTAAVLNGKLLQLCGGAVYDGDGHVVPVHNCKEEAFLELVEALQGEHALVYYWFAHERERILNLLHTKRKDLRVRVYQGEADEAAWNAGEVDILLAQPASCAYGLNLQQGGHHVIWYTLPNWNLELFEQANKRLHRQGQEFPVLIHILNVQGGMDEDVMRSLMGKGDTQDALLRALKARVEKYRKETVA